jgi:hypothetical protein
LWGTFAWRRVWLISKAVDFSQCSFCSTFHPAACSTGCLEGGIWLANKSCLGWVLCLDLLILLHSSNHRGKSWNKPIAPKSDWSWKIISVEFLVTQSCFLIFPKMNDKLFFIPIFTLSQCLFGHRRNFLSYQHKSLWV